MRLRKNDEHIKRQEKRERETRRTEKGRENQNSMQFEHTSLLAKILENH